MNKKIKYPVMIIFISSLTGIGIGYSSMDYSDYEYPTWVSTSEIPSIGGFHNNHLDRIPLSDEQIHQNFILGCTPQKILHGKGGVSYYTSPSVLEDCLNTIIDAKLAPIQRELKELQEKK